MTIMEKVFGPDHYEGLARTWKVILDRMRSDPTAWVSQADVITYAVRRGHNLGTVRNLIRSATQHGRLRQRGAWARGSDTRELRMALR
jgi:hypothetical protein